MFLKMEILLMEHEIIFKFRINNIIYKCEFRNGKLYNKEIENGNDNYNDNIDLNNIQFQKEDNDIKYKFIFKLNFKSFGNNYLERLIF